MVLEIYRGVSGTSKKTPDPVFVPPIKDSRPRFFDRPTRFSTPFLSPRIDKNHLVGDFCDPAPPAFLPHRESAPAATARGSQENPMFTEMKQGQLGGFRRINPSAALSL